MIQSPRDSKSPRSTTVRRNH